MSGRSHSPGLDPVSAIEAEIDRLIAAQERITADIDKAYARWRKLTQAKERP